VALALAGQRSGYEWPLPSAFITNQFYYLNTGKFSTSKGHAIWARDLSTECNTDMTRLFLAMHGPEYQEGTFSEQIFRMAVAEFAAKINKLADAYNRRRVSAEMRDGSLPDSLITLMSREVPLSEYSSALLARRAIHCLEYLEHLLSTQQEVPLASVPSAVALCLGPFCPIYTAQLKQSFNITENSWTNLAQCHNDATLPVIQEEYAHAL
jgi:methionyl-tRNA synthetase